MEPSRQACLGHSGAFPGYEAFSWSMGIFPLLEVRMSKESPALGHHWGCEGPIVHYFLSGRDPVL